MMNCPVCQNNLNGSLRFFPREMRIGLKENFEYLYCNNCKCLFISQVPENIDVYYSNYYTESKKFVNISPLRKFIWKIRSSLTLTGLYPIIRVFRKNNILRWLNHMNISFSDQILDVGCGNGDILFEFSKHGFKNLNGVDPFPPKKVSAAFNWKFVKGDIFSINNKKFKVIMFNHSLEHAINHLQILEKAKDLLCENGTILVRMPIVNKAFEIYGENWVQLDAPRHLLIHSLNSFNILIKKLNLEIYHIIFDSTEYQFMGSEQYKQNITHYAPESYKMNLKKSIFTLEESKRYKKLAAKYNTLRIGDQATFFVKRSGI